MTWTEPTATDNSGVVTLSQRTHAPGSFFVVGTTAVTYTYVDGSGNSAQCTFDVRVIERKFTTFKVDLFAFSMVERHEFELGFALG